MQVGQKKTQSAPAEAAPGTRPDLKGVADGSAHTPFSPARALQARLAREWTRTTTPWTWHSAGVLMTLMLACWMAVVLLGAAL